MRSTVECLAYEFHLRVGDGLLRRSGVNVDRDGVGVLRDAVVHSVLRFEARGGR